MLDLMAGLLGSPNERIWPGMAALPHADKFQLPAQPYNYLRKARGAPVQGPTDSCAFACTESRAAAVWLAVLHLGCACCCRRRAGGNA